MSSPKSSNIGITKIPVESAQISLGILRISVQPQKRTGIGGIPFAIIVSQSNHQGIMVSSFPECLTSAIRELFSLFIDDVPFTIAILSWIGVRTLGLPHLTINTGWTALLLFLGFAVHAGCQRLGRGMRG